MREKTVVITGGNAGIGKATAIALAKKGAQIFITSRTEEKAQAAVTQIKKETANEAIDFLTIDLSSLKSVRETAEQIKTKCPRIDVLINNAGCYFSELKLNDANIEMQFATNHLGHFLLTNLLLDNLKAAEKARIINLSSMAHKSTRKLDLDDINFEKEGYGGWKSYSRSKFCNILFTKELARKLAGTGITVNAVHPGGVRTEIAEKNANWYTKIGWILGKPFFITVEKGAATSIHLASSPEVAEITGQYWYKSKQVWSNKPSQDSKMAAALWEKSEELVEKSFTF